MLAIVIGVGIVSTAIAFQMRQAEMGIPCGSLTAIVGITGTPSVANPIYHGQQSMVNITGYGEVAGNIGTYEAPIPGATAALVVNGTSSQSTTLGRDSKGYVYYVFPSVGYYSVYFKLSYNEVVCYSHDTESANSSSIVVEAK